MKFIKQHPEIIIIFLIGLILRLFYAHLDPYLHEWDERYHALVAQNLIHNPFTPLLQKNPIVPYELNSWCCNSIWLHKQPLFMWQMALSMKLFGVSEFTMRYPSAIMGAISIVLVYRITLLFTLNKNTSIIAALLICFSHYQLELISGQIGMDHNDVAFSFYILASFWAYSESIKNNKFIWYVLIGVFAGCAILCKWLVGLLVFLPFGVYVIYQILYSHKFSFIKYFLISLFCCLIIALPWQLYILYNFYDLAMYEYKYNSQHLFTVVENHKGNMFFYLKNFNKYFGNFVWVFIPIGIFISLKIRSKYEQILNYSLLSVITAVFIFFSIIAQTKLISYFFIAVPFIIIYIAISLEYINSHLKNKLLQYAIILFILIISLNPIESYKRRKNNSQRDALIYNTTIYKNIKNLIPSKVKTLINVNSFENIDVMFFNNNLNVYHWWIDVKMLDSLKKNKVWLGAFKNHGDYNLPPEYNNYPYLYFINKQLK
jgi:4-amino-4-deoxy-L-arabinose transferase-like glycosyltransferase